MNKGHWKLRASDMQGTSTAQQPGNFMEVTSWSWCSDPIWVYSARTHLFVYWTLRLRCSQYLTWCHLNLDALSFIVMKPYHRFDSVFILENLVRILFVFLRPPWLPTDLCSPSLLSCMFNVLSIINISFFSANDFCRPVILFSYKCDFNQKPLFCVCMVIHILSVQVQIDFGPKLTKKKKI